MKKARCRQVLRDANAVMARDSFITYRNLIRYAIARCAHYTDVTQISSAFRQGDWRRVLVEADSLVVQKYATAAQHFAANQLAALIRKYPFPKQVVDLRPRESARLTFLKQERRCMLLNKKFKLTARLRNPFSYEFQAMRDWIQYVIGSRPPLRVIQQLYEFGSGASVGVHGNRTHIGQKLVSKLTVTPGAHSYALVGMAHNYQLFESFLDSSRGLVCYSYDDFRKEAMKRIEMVNHNKISFVPKTAKTHRVIAIEPSLNTYVQKGADLYLRRCLAKVGVTLNDQKRNMEQARIGSATWSDTSKTYATIDLSNASDSISIGLVRELLPVEWFEFLNNIRSPNYSLDGKVHTYHKFCSSGNGFCFPLESLIFAAIVKASGAFDKGSRIYGDDIIVPSAKFDHVVKLLNFCGFKVNPRKTFNEGPFRESCGADWYAGTDVRPYTLDHALDSLPNMFKFLNLSMRNELSRSFFFDIRPLILGRIPIQFQYWRPFVGNPDTGIDSTGDEHLTSDNCSFKNCCWHWKELMHASVEDSIFHAQHASESRLYEMYALLRGNPSGSHGKVFLALRHKTKARTVRKYGGGATSTWLPPIGVSRERHRP